MLALAYRGPHRLELEERPLPEPGAGELVVRVDACSICGTDLRIAEGSHHAYGAAEGRVPGHELAGTVVARGSGAGPQVGTRVFVAPNFGCGVCRECRRGDVNLCQAPRALGITEDGGFAEAVRLPQPLVEQGNVIPLTGDPEAATMALAEPLASVVRGSRACRIQSGEAVLIFGAGAIGLLHLALARLAGAGAVVVGEPNPVRHPRAVTAGAASVHGADPEALRHALDAVGATRGADVVIVAAPAASAMAAAVELAAPAARINLFAGLARAASTVALDLNRIHYRELVVTGTSANTNRDCREALELIHAGRVQPAALIDARFPLARALDAFALAGSGRALKVVIEP